jgi:Ca2+-binding EF-hand superfamily protein
LTFLARKTVDLDSKERNIKDQIFEVFDDEPNSKKPLINSSDLIRILGELNEPCEREEIEKLLKESSINGEKKNNEIAIGTRGICMF